jgi:hypothetical protein
MTPNTIGIAALYDILPTPYGGRGAYARQPIPKGTLILSCSAPYVHVVFWKFRREVCAWCFAYAFESGKNKWSVRLAEGSRGEGGGAWFCSAECRGKYLCEHEVLEGQNGDWRAEINASFARLLSQMGKDEKQPENGSRGASPFAHLEDISADVITQDFVDCAWTLAKDSPLQGHQRRKSESVEELNEFEIDTARFILEGLIRKIIEELNPSAPILDRVDEGASGYRVGAGRWADFMALQDNEIPFIQSKPYMLVSQIRIYRFLRNLAYTLFKPQRSRDKGEGLLVQIAERLRDYLSSPDYVRALLGRDPGNVFGIWDMATDEGSEMLGWGAFVFASYFNHRMCFSIHL